MARVHVADKRGVQNLEQEPDAIESATNTDSAPAYRSIRTDRYEYTIYANGQTELYDMKRDPAQLHSLAARSALSLRAQVALQRAGPTLELRRALLPGRARAGPAAPLQGGAAKPEKEEAGSGDGTAREPALAEPGQAVAAEAARVTIRRPGALAKLDKAPASKVGDSRFESWVPRSACSCCP